VLGVLGTHEIDELREATWIVISLQEVTAQLTADGVRLRFATIGT
jgi:hypothetical protein